MEELKREIVEGPNYMRREKQKEALVIESDSDRRPEAVEIGTSYKEIDACYNNVIASFRKAKKPKRIEDYYTNGKND
jgi:hypothetical protein